MDTRQFDGYETIRLHTKESELPPDPPKGLTVVSFKVHGTECIFYDHERKEEGKTYGIPPLFPTPNRIRDTGTPSKAGNTKERCTASPA